MSVDNSELLMLLAAKKSRPLTENNLIVQSTRGNGSTSATDALEKEFTFIWDRTKETKCSQ